MFKNNDISMKQHFGFLFTDYKRQSGIVLHSSVNNGEIETRFLPDDIFHTRSLCWNNNHSYLDKMVVYVLACCSSPAYGNYPERQFHSSIYQQ